MVACVVGGSTQVRVETRDLLVEMCLGLSACDVQRSLSREKLIEDT